MQNARLHAFMLRQAGVGSDVRRDRRSDRGLRRARAPAARQRGARRVLGPAVTTLRDLTCDEVGLCGGTYPDCAVGHAARTACEHAEVTLPDDQIFSVTTCPVVDATDGAAVVQIAKNVTLEIRNARRMPQMSDELAGTNARLVATVERLKTTQAQLLQAEKLSAIGQLVAGVAHELNNPLTSVIGYAQLLEEELRDPAPEATARPTASARTTCAGSPRSPSAPPGSSATCSRSRAGRRPSARRRTSPISSAACSRCAPTSSA